VDGFLKDLDERKDFSADTVRQKRQKVKKLAEAFGANRLTQITGDDIEDWIESDLGYDNPHTFNNWRKHIRSFFDFYRKEIFQNPCDDIRTMDDATDHVGILTPVQTAKLFAFALTDNRRHIIGRLALEAFAGLRFASAYRLEKADINFKDKGILLPKHKKMCIRDRRISRSQSRHCRARCSRCRCLRGPSGRSRTAGRCRRLPHARTRC